MNLVFWIAGFILVIVGCTTLVFGIIKKEDIFISLSKYFNCVSLICVILSSTLSHFF